MDNNIIYGLSFAEQLRRKEEGGLRSQDTFLRAMKDSSLDYEIKNLGRNLAEYRDKELTYGLSVGEQKYREEDKQKLRNALEERKKHNYKPFSISNIDEQIQKASSEGYLLSEFFDHPEFIVEIAKRGLPSLVPSLLNYLSVPVDAATIGIQAMTGNDMHGYITGMNGGNSAAKSVNGRASLFDKNAAENGMTTEEFAKYLLEKSDKMSATEAFRYTHEGETGAVIGDVLELLTEPITLGAASPAINAGKRIVGGVGKLATGGVAKMLGEKGSGVAKLATAVPTTAMKKIINSGGEVVKGSFSEGLGGATGELARTLGYNNDRNIKTDGDKLLRDYVNDFTNEGLTGGAFVATAHYAA